MDERTRHAFRPRRSQAEDDGFDREELVLAALDVEMAWIDLGLVVDGRAELACEDLCERRTWVYRGWMLSAEEHEELEEAVRDRRGCLLVRNDAYTTASYLPEWAPLLGEHTPLSEWIFGDGLDEAWEAAQRLGPPPWILKDHVKSVSDDWEGACFVPAGADRARFCRTARAMTDARGERFERGIVIRQDEAPRTLGYRLAERAVPDEHRVVFVRCRIVAHAPYFEVEARTLDQAELRHLEAIGRPIPSSFFVLDVMRAAAGGDALSACGGRSLGPTRPGAWGSRRRRGPRLTRGGSPWHAPQVIDPQIADELSRLSPSERAWAEHDLALRERAATIARDLQLDPRDVYHVLRSLERTPSGIRCTRTVVAR